MKKIILGLMVLALVILGVKYFDITGPRLIKAEGKLKEGAWGVLIKRSGAGQKEFIGEGEIKEDMISLVANLTRGTISGNYRWGFEVEKDGIINIVEEKGVFSGTIGEDKKSFVGEYQGEYLTEGIVEGRSDQGFIADGVTRGKIEGEIRLDQIVGWLSIPEIIVAEKEFVSMEEALAAEEAILKKGGDPLKESYFYFEMQR